MCQKERAYLRKCPLYFSTGAYKLNREIKNKIKRAGMVAFLLYIATLIYFLFFSESYGRAGFAEREYHYNVVPFREIKRFWIYREQLGVFAVVTNLLGNVVGFVPFGFMLPLIVRRARGFFLITLLGFALSLFVEVVQLITKVGCFDVDDLILNTLGAAVGYILFAVCHLIDDQTRRKKYGEKEI